MQLLLDSGADVHAVSESGKTALKAALAMTNPNAHRGRGGRVAPEHVYQESAARSVPIVEMLRKAGA